MVASPPTVIEFPPHREKFTTEPQRVQSLRSFPYVFLLLGVLCVSVVKNNYLVATPSRCVTLPCRPHFLHGRQRTTRADVCGSAAQGVRGARTGGCVAHPGRARLHRHLRRRRNFELPSRGIRPCVLHVEGRRSAIARGDVAGASAAAALPSGERPGGDRARARDHLRRAW